MSDSNEMKLVTIDNVHIEITNFINENQIFISSYEDMTQAILKMIQNKYLFNFDKNLLRSIMEDITFMYCPGDDLNRDRILNMLDASSDEEDEEGEEDDEGNIPTIDDGQ